MRQTDFPELAKKKVKVYQNGREYDALVVDVNYFVGISVVMRNNPDKILFCLIYKNAVKQNIIGLYTDFFYSLIEQIKSGKISEKVNISIMKKYNYNQNIDGSIDEVRNSCPWK